MSELRYVQRDELGNIVAAFVHPQPQPDGSCLTEADPVHIDDPEMLEFEAKQSGVGG